MTKKWRRDYVEGHKIDESSDNGSLTSAINVSRDENPFIDIRSSSMGRSPMPNNDSGEEAIDFCWSNWPVVLYIPNLLGYLRILLSFYGLKHALQQHPNKALNIWIVAAILDLFDGIAARMMNQCSQFGILLDIVADNILRSIVWISTMIESSKSTTSGEIEICVWVAIICLEWITMFCSQSNEPNEKDKDQNVHWKDVKTKSEPPPFWVQAVFKNNFRSPAGVLAMCGLFVAPLGSYIRCADRVNKSTWPFQFLPEDAISILVKISYAGRLLSAIVELWICRNYLMKVIARDAVSKQTGVKQKGL